MVSILNVIRKLECYKGRNSEMSKNVLAPQRFRMVMGVVTHR